MADERAAEARSERDLREELDVALVQGAGVAAELGAELLTEAVRRRGEDRLVVAAEEEDAAREGDLEGEEEREGLDAPGAAVDKVAVEDEQRVVRGGPGRLEEAADVLELRRRDKGAWPAAGNARM